MPGAQHLRRRSLLYAVCNAAGLLCTHSSKALLHYSDVADSGFASKGPQQASAGRLHQVAAIVNRKKYFHVRCVAAKRVSHLLSLTNSRRVSVG